jgi:hypothetical protein
VPRASDRAPALEVGLISAAALAYEVLLIRLFAIVHWHHLVAIAIGLALLGYGISGTFLALFRQRVARRFNIAFVGNALLFGISSALCVVAAERIPFDPEALVWEPAQFQRLAGAFLLLTVPFFAAANCVGLALMQFPATVSRVYGFDLLGAGLGAVAVLGALILLHPADALLGVALLGLAIASLAARRLRWYPRGVGVIALALGAGLLAFGLRPTLQPAPYKDLAQALAVVGAETVHQDFGPAGALSVVRNPVVPLRTATGMSLQARALPPPQQAVFVDGDLLDSVPETVPGEGDEAYQAELINALPFSLLEAPRVAVLHAAAGSRVRQALALGAAEVVALEPNPMLQALACAPSAAAGGNLCADRRVHWQVQAPRAYLAGDAAPFDLIGLSTTAQRSGLDALAVDFELTREAFEAYLAHLAPGGFVLVEGPTRVPPRLALRALATAQAALQASAASAPAAHLAMIRGWRHFALLVGREPLGSATIAAIRTFAEQRGFDLVWLPGMRADEANRFQRLREAWFHQGAVSILGGGDAGAAEGRFDLAAATDDRPYPRRFSRWSEVWQALGQGDSTALAQLDLGLLLAVAMLALVGLIAAALILLPLLALRAPAAAGAKRDHRRLRAFAYFGLIGLAFLFIEIGWIQRLQLFLGHPVYATTAVLAAFLVFAGLGSLWSQRRADSQGGRLLWLAILLIALISVGYLLFLPDLLQRLAGQSLAVRLLLVLVLLAPLAFAMGMPFPLGLRGLGRSDARLVPWAWGINGCASVIAAGSTPLLAAEVGFSGLTAIAVAAYLSLPLLRVSAGRGDN